MQFPKIIIDTREQRPLVFDPLPITIKKLDFGDYSLKGYENRICIERKSVPDLWGTITQKDNWSRFNIELAKAQIAGCKLHIVIEGSVTSILKGSKYSIMAPSKVLDRLFEVCHRYGSFAVFAGEQGFANDLVLSILRGAWRVEQ